MYAKGMTENDIAAHIEEIYGLDVSDSTISRVTDKILPIASRRYLRDNPLCVMCKNNGRFVEATVVDHIVLHRGNQKLFWDKNNWQALCKPCHDKKTGTEDSTPTYRY